MIMVVMEWMVAAALLLGCAFAANSVLPTQVMSTAVLTPTPSPTPSEELIPVNSYRANEKEGDGPACIHLRAGIQLLVNYTNKDKLENTSIIVVRDEARVVYDNNATVCREKNSNMTVSWTNDCNRYNDTYLLIFEFGTDSVQNTWEMVNVTFKFVSNDCDFPDIDEETRDKFSVSLNHGIMDRNASHCHYYGCDTPKLFYFDTNDSPVITNVTMLIQDLRVETYCSRDSAKNGSIDLHFGEWCADDPRTNSTISIAVGAAIGALLLAVLVIFIIGRITSRSKRIGYEKLQ